ncbi:MAG: hypothetical protein J2P36_19495 [Ktedonobacteraceae bacterium]|nr:hypothetical protein [Ktedonobacteraceae bacterium]
MDQTHPPEQKSEHSRTGGGWDWLKSHFGQKPELNDSEKAERIAILESRLGDIAFRNKRVGTALSEARQVKEQAEQAAYEDRKNATQLTKDAQSLHDKTQGVIEIAEATRSSLEQQLDALAKIEGRTQKLQEDISKIDERLAGLKTMVDEAESRAREAEAKAIESEKLAAEAKANYHDVMMQTWENDLDREKVNAEIARLKGEDRFANVLESTFPYLEARIAENKFEAARWRGQEDTEQLYQAYLEAEERNHQTSSPGVFNRIWDKLGL